MGWSFRIARVAGIDIKVHVTFFLILVWVAMIYGRDPNGPSVGEGIVFTLAVFACVVLHELGHALAARRYGVRTRDIILLPIGGVARLERMPEKPAQELVVAIAGPLVNVVIAALLGAYLVATDTVPRFDPELAAGDISFWARLAFVNLFLVAFNLIPAFPMDGGRMLRALLALRTTHARATQIAAALGQGLAFLFGLLGLLAGQPFLIFIALFVWIGAAQEASLAQLKHGLGGVPVEQVMLTDFYVLRPDEPLRKAVELTMAGSQRDFPVVDGHRPVGLLTQARLLEGLRSSGEATPVGEVMETEIATADSREMIEPVFERLQASRTRTVPVLEGGRLRGLLTLENVAEFLAIQAALERRHEREAIA